MAATDVIWNGSTDQLGDRILTVVLPIKLFLPRISDFVQFLQSFHKLADSVERERTESLPSHILQLPCEDWGFNIFLDDLASDISNDELERLKNYVSGDGGLGLRILEAIDTPLELFKVLKKRMIVTRDNLISLQGMLWHLKNKELHKKAVEYARTIGNTLYFYAPSERPENGYKHVKIHVEGKDVSKIRRSFLEQLRTLVSQLLMVPPQFVIVSGLEPSCSIIITFMLPEYHVSLLAEILSRTSIADLAELGINCVYIDGKKFSLSVESEEFEVLAYQEEQKLAKTFERLQFVEKQLEHREIECLVLSKELEASRRELKEVGLKKAHLCDLMGILHRLDLFRKGTLEPKNGEVASMKIQSALANLRFSLKKVKEMNYDTDVIMNVLQANSYLVEIRVKEGFSNLIKIMMTDIQQQKAVITSQQHAIELLQFISETTPEEVLFVMSQLWNACQHLAAQTVSISISAPARQLLRKYSHQLHKRDKQKLRKFHNWSKGEYDIVEKNPTIFLEMLVTKEYQRLGIPIDLERYLPPLFEEISRKDLARRYVDEVRKIESEQKRQINEATAQSTPPQNKESKEQQHNQQLDEMNTRLKNMEKMIKELKDIKDESPNLLKDPMNPMKMPIWGTKLWSILKEKKEAENSQPYAECF